VGSGPEDNDWAGTGRSDGPDEADALVAAFTRWAASERVSEAASQRSRQRWLALQAGSTATWAGALLDLAEQSSSVTIDLAATGKRLQGRLVGVGRDFCVVALRNGRPALVALSAVAMLWPDARPDALSDARPGSRPGSRPDGRSAGHGGGGPAGDRTPPLELTLVAALAELAEERTPVVVHCGEHHAEGDLISVGEDVLAVRGAPPSRRTAYIPLAAMAWCEVR
jgi:hypothetical protein